MSARALALALLGASWLPAIVEAQPAGDEGPAAEGDGADAQTEAAYRARVEEAVRHSREGRLREGRLREALALFLQAHELRPSARTLRGIGLVRFGLADYAGAIDALEASLADPRRPLEPEDRAEAEGVIERARRFVTRVVLSLEPADAQVLVDGRAVTLPDPPTLRLNPGRHELRFAREGHVEQTRVLSVEGGGEQALAVTLRPERSAAPAQEPPAVALRVRSRPPGLVLHASPLRDDGEPVPNAITEVCAAPCAATLDPGLYRLGVARPRQAPSGGGTYRLEAPLDVMLHYDDRTDFRTAGWITLGVSVAGAVALVASMAAVTSIDSWAILSITGGSVLVAGAAVGLPLVLYFDGPALEVRPQGSR